jgi:hypothetical protein
MANGRWLSVPELPSAIRRDQPFCQQAGSFSGLLSQRRQFFTLLTESRLTRLGETLHGGED